MSIALNNPRSEYIGAGNNKDYTFDFKITSLSDILIRVSDADFVKQFEVRGTDVVYLTSVDFDPINGMGEIHLTSNLATGYHLTILLATDDPLQPYEWRNKGDFYIRDFESMADMVVNYAQRFMYLARRSLRISDDMPQADADQFDPSIPIHSIDDLIEDNADKILAIGDDNKSIKLGPTTQAIFDAQAAAVAAADAAADDAIAAAADAAASAAAAAAAAADGGAAEAAQIAAEAAQVAAEAAQAAAEVAQAAAEQAAADAVGAVIGVVLSGTRAAPVAVIGANGIVFSSPLFFNTHFVEGSGGPVTLSAAARIQAGVTVGQRLTLICRSDVNTITVPDGNGINTFGQTIVMVANTILTFVWDGTEWVLESNNGAA